MRKKQFTKEFPNFTTIHTLHWNIALPLVRAYEHNNNKIQNKSQARGARSKFFNKLAHVARCPAAFLLHTFGSCSIAAATCCSCLLLLFCCCCCCNSAYLRVFARQCYTNGNFEAVCGCLPSAGRDFCYQPRLPQPLCAPCRLSSA